MLKIVFPVCCGIDVHKKFVVATIATTDQNNITTYKTREFLTFTQDLLKLSNWLKENNCYFVCMESTGKYWIPVYSILEKSCDITLANPKFIRNIPGKKTDKRDSIWIADLHKHGLVMGSFIPPENIRALRDLFRYRFKLVNMRSGEKNRFQNSLTMSNIMISSVVSDTFGKSAQAIIKFMLDNPNIKDFDFISMLHTKLIPKAELIKKSIDGNISSTQSVKMTTCLNHFNALNQCIAQIDETISLLTAQFKPQIDLLSTIPGITEKSASSIISEIGVDMSLFSTSKKICSWAGLSPQNNESAGKKKNVHISRAGDYIKPLLVQCANAAIKDKSCPYFRFRYEQIKKRRGHKRAIIAIARMLLTCIYNMLIKNEVFNTELYHQYLLDFKKPQVNNNVQAAIKFLSTKGFIIESVQPIGETKTHLNLD